MRANADGAAMKCMCLLKGQELMLRKAFNQISQSAVYREDKVSVSITVCGGSYGGGQRDFSGRSQ